MKISNLHKETENIETLSTSDSEYRVVIFLHDCKYSNEVVGSIVANVNVDVSFDGFEYFDIYEVIVNKFLVRNHDDMIIKNHEVTPKEIAAFLEDCEFLLDHKQKEFAKLAEEKDL